MGLLLAVGLQADGDVGMTVEIVHHIHDVGIGAAHPVDNYPEQVAAAHIHIAVQHHQGEQVVGRTAHIAVEDDADILLLIVAPDVDALAEVVDRVLVVLPGEFERRGEAVLRENPGAVEIILALLGVVPAAHHIVVGAGVFDDGRNALLVEVILGLLVRNRDALCRLAQGVQAYGKAVRIHLAHCPDDTGKFLVGKLLLAEDGRHDQNGKAKKGKQTFHRCVICFYKITQINRTKKITRAASRPSRRCPTRRTCNPAASRSRPQSRRIWPHNPTGTYPGYSGGVSWRDRGKWGRARGESI